MVLSVSCLNTYLQSLHQLLLHAAQLLRCCILRVAAAGQALQLGLAGGVALRCCKAELNQRLHVSLQEHQTESSEQLTRCIST